jgi:hypothetical protein
MMMFGALSASLRTESEKYHGGHRFRHSPLFLFMFIDFISLFPNWLPMSAE